jgi:hypothetical protein
MIPCRPVSVVETRNWREAKRTQFDSYGKGTGKEREVSYF